MYCAEMSEDIWFMSAARSESALEAGGVCSCSVFEMSKSGSVVSIGCPVRICWRQRSSLCSVLK